MINATEFGEGKLIGHAAFTNMKEEVDLVKRACDYLEEGYGVEVMVISTNIAYPNSFMAHFFTDDHRMFDLKEDGELYEISDGKWSMVKKI